MSSLTERVVLLADDVRLDFLEEAREELVGRSRRKWALVAIAFFVGIAVALAFVMRRASDPSEAFDDGAAEDGAAASASPERADESRPWQRWAGNARAGLSTAWSRPSLR